MGRDRVRMPRAQTESQAQRIVCQWLEIKGLLYCHVPNGGQRARVEAKIFKGLGVKAGVPDLLIFDKPAIGCYVGVALELKRERGGKLSPHQQRWQEELRKRGWLVACHAGSNAAIDWLESLYGIGG